MRLVSNPEVDALVAAARLPREGTASPKPEDLADYGLRAVETTADPYAAQSWFRDLAAETEREIASDGSQHQRLLARARWWSRWTLGPDREPDEYDDLARRWAIAQRVNELANANPERHSAALIKDEGGLALIRAGGTGVMVGYLHTGFVLGYGATFVGEVGRPVFVHADDAGERRPGTVRPAIEASGEALGWRFVGPRRRLEVFVRLLQEGEIVALPADVPGVADGTLLGRPVRTTRAPAALAKSASVPLVLMAGFWNDAGYELRMSKPIQPDSFDSVKAMHAAVMQQVDTWLQDHPEQLQIRFPAAELSRLIARNRALATRLDELQHAVDDARSALDETTQALEKGESTDAELTEARQLLAQTKHDHAELTRELRDVKSRVRLDR